MCKYINTFINAIPHDKLHFKKCCNSFGTGKLTSDLPESFYLWDW